MALRARRVIGSPGRRLNLDDVGSEIIPAVAREWSSQERTSQTAQAGNGPEFS